MAEARIDRLVPMLEAVSFAARAHRHQVRKDGQTPYAAHPFRVCLIVRHVFGIDDPAVLTAALLHDTIEDTTTDFDDLAEHFGADVAGWVGVLSKDKRLADPARESAYMAGLVAAPGPVQIAKLADILDNLIDSRRLSDENRIRSISRAQAYLNALRETLADVAKVPFTIVQTFLVESTSRSG